MKLELVKRERNEVCKVFAKELIPLLHHPDEGRVREGRAWRFVLRMCRLSWWLFCSRGRSS